MTEQKRILVVDDAALVRRTATTLLEGAGYEVESAASGEEAFELCLEKTFDLVVTDVRMGALSGMQLCRLLRSDPSTAWMPIFLLAGDDDARSRFWGKIAGADAFLRKEDMFKELVVNVARVLETVRRPPTGTIATLRRKTPPLERLSEILDKSLFEAVLASEVRRLSHHLEDRTAFLSAIAELIRNVTEFHYLAIRLDGPSGPTWALEGRGPLPQALDQAALDALGLEAHVDQIVALSRHDRLTGSLDQVTRPTRFPIVHGETLGELLFYPRGRGIAHDIGTMDLVARELGIVVRAMFLMEQARDLANTDALTGLPNRRHGMQRLQHEIDRAHRLGQDLSIAIVDVDHFKAINDRFGHNVGDEVLRRVGRGLREALRRIDFVARWGGEEFMVVLPGTALRTGLIAAERLRARVEGDDKADATHRATVSVGIAMHASGESLDALVARADAGLYDAKRLGRNRVEAGR